jgi:hypothetical protein
VRRHEAQQPSDPIPEHGPTHAGSDSAAVPTIPGLLSRAREVEVDTTLVIEMPPAAASAGHEITVQTDGQRQWSQRTTSANLGQTNGLEHHQRVRLDVAAGVNLGIGGTCRLGWCAGYPTHQGSSRFIAATSPQWSGV